MLGDSGIEVSRLGLGCDNFGWRPGVGLPETRAVVDAALDAGVTFFDTAEAYGDGDSERFLGEFGVRVEGGGSRDYVRGAVERSLERLGVDHIDLYYYHQPDGVTPVAETLGAMQELVREGKVRAIGCSQFPPELLREAEAHADASGEDGFVAVQNEYSLLHREPEGEMLELCRERRIGFVPYFPLASGLLTGKYRRGAAPPSGSRLEDWRPPADKAGSPDRPAVLTDCTFDRVEALDRWAADRDRTLLELAIGYLASQPGVSSVITGATKPEQIEMNVAAAGWQLSPDELEQVAALAGDPLSTGVA
jgi:aryl-alcohol dehydrogenase-like predicted oxidoreductase